MVRFGNGNHKINATAGRAAAGVAPSKRAQVFRAVQEQLNADNKRPWKLDQKLNDAPYRYSRDSLWVSIIGVSERLASYNPPVDFGVEGRFRTGRYASYAEFIEKQLRGTLSSLINEVKDASR